MKKKISILVGICSARHYLHKRNAVRETWLRHPQEGIECLFFTGGDVDVPPDEASDMIGLPVTDTYNGLPEKVQAFFAYALENYDFEWLFKCDDDTYLDLSRLHSLVDSRYGIIGDMMLQTRNAPSGGAGYFLSRRIVEKIVGMPCPATGAEDLIFGSLALQAGAEPLATPRLNSGYSRYPLPANDVVSAHWCAPATMKAIYTLNQSKPDAIYSGTHKLWKDDIFFFASGIFKRKSSFCFGTWKMEKTGTLLLEWDSWPPQQFILREDKFIGSDTILSKTNGSRDILELATRTPCFTEGLAIHPGCGNRFIPGWLNLDLPHYDISRPLPWKDDSIQAYFLEHVIEYLSPQDFFYFLEEARRTLLTGGIIRIAFTDIRALQSASSPAVKLLVNNYKQGSPLSLMILEGLVRAKGQRSFWTSESLTAFLELGGFIVSSHLPGESSSPLLENLERTEEEKKHPFEFAGGMCLEARKR